MVDSWDALQAVSMAVMLVVVRVGWKAVAMGASMVVVWVVVMVEN